MVSVLLAYSIFMFLISLHLIDVKLDDRHSISLLQLIALRSIGAKGIYYKDWLSFTPCFLNWSRGFFYPSKKSFKDFSNFFSVTNRLSISWWKVVYKLSNSCW